MSVLPTMFPELLPRSCSFIHSSRKILCTGYVPELFLDDRACSVSKSCFAQAGAGTALFITMSSALSCCPLKPQSKPVGKNQECAGPFDACPNILLWATGEELRPKSLSSTYRPVPQAGDARRGGMNSAGLTVSKSFPRPSTVTIDSSLRPDQPLRSADPEEVNKRKILEVCATNFHRECYCTMGDKERLFVRIKHKTGEGPAVIN